jgi:flagellar hook-length control protein FliK
MELVAPLPAELTAIVDPAARGGAAPLLRSVSKDGDAPVAAMPFGVFLELLAARAPAGEGLPAAGKSLPPLPLAVTATPDATVATPPRLWLLEAAVPAGLWLEGAAAFVSPRPAPATAAQAPTSPLAPPVAPNAAPLPAALSTTTLAEPLAMPAAPPDPPAAPPGVDAPTVDAARELTPPASREPFATTGESQLRPPPIGDARAATPPAAAGGETRAAPPPADVAAPLLRVVQRDGSHFTLRPVAAAADAAGAPPADWLPPAATQSSAVTATSPPAAPAPAHTSLDMNAPNWHEAFASRVRMLVDTQVGEARIKLNPPELGAVDVKISLVDDQTFVQLTAATAGARDELSQGLPRLRELLVGSGLELGGASVHSGRDGRHEGGGDAGRGAARFDRAVLEPGRLDERATPAPGRAAGRIDVFA